MFQTVFQIDNQQTTLGPLFNPFTTAEFVDLIPAESIADKAFKKLMNKTKRGSSSSACPKQA